MILLEQERQQGLCDFPVEMDFSTPKRKASGSNPLRNAENTDENLAELRFLPVFFMLRKIEQALQAVKTDQAGLIKGFRMRKY